MARRICAAGLRRNHRGSSMVDAISSKPLLACACSLLSPGHALPIGVPIAMYGTDPLRRAVGMGKSMCMVKVRMGGCPTSARRWPIDLWPSWDLQPNFYVAMVVCAVCIGGRAVLRRPVCSEPDRWNAMRAWRVMSMKHACCSVSLSVPVKLVVVWTVHARVIRRFSGLRRSRSWHAGSLCAHWDVETGKTRVAN